VPVNKANSKSATGVEARRLRNRLMRSKYKTSLTKVGGLIASNEVELAQSEAVVATSNIDKAVKKKVIHKNKGANLKSKLNKKLNNAKEETDSKKSEVEKGDG
jgi:small subunit ribosomal protein S20